MQAWQHKNIINKTRSFEVLYNFSFSFCSNINYIYITGLKTFFYQNGQERQDKCVTETRNGRHITSNTEVLITMLVVLWEKHKGHTHTVTLITILSSDPIVHAIIFHVFSYFYLFIFITAQMILAKSWLFHHHQSGVKIK